MSKRKFENKPKWDELPPKAQWRCMDNDGTWCWFVTKPRALVDDGCWYRGTEGNVLHGRPRTPSAYWMQSLDQRPA